MTYSNHLPKISAIIFITALFVLNLSCNNYGTKIDYKGGELYYTNKVTEDEAKKLGDYLAAQKFFNDTNQIKISVQLNKEGDTFQFRMVVRKEVVADTLYITSFKQINAEISKLFDGAKVETHMCDQYFKTIKVIAYEKPKITDLTSCTKLEFNKGELFYTSAIAADEANKLGERLVQDKFFDGTPKTIMIHKEGSRYQFRMIIKNQYLNDEAYIKNVKLYAKVLSVTVFDNAPVDLQFCNPSMKTLKGIKFD